MTCPRIGALLLLVSIALIASGCGGSTEQAGSTATELSATSEPLASDGEVGSSRNGPLPEFSDPSAIDNPEVDPDQFTADVDNSHFPLPNGATWAYQVTTAEGSTDHLDVVVTDQTRTVAGVETTVVEVTLTVDGEIEEITESWYAQHDNGAVWLFGEIDHGYEDGELVETTTWEAGVNGAQPGVVMLGDNLLNETYRVGYVAGVMEERGRLAESDASISTRVGDFTAIWVVENWSDLEPTIVERKHYAPGVGLVFAHSESADSDTIELVATSLAP